MQGAYQRAQAVLQGPTMLGFAQEQGMVLRRGHALEWFIDLADYAGHWSRRVGVGVAAPMGPRAGLVHGLGVNALEVEGVGLGDACGHAVRIGRATLVQLWWVRQHTRDSGRRWHALNLACGPTAECAPTGWL